MGEAIVYLKSVVVFVLCTAFVLSFVAVLNYDTAGIGKQAPPVSTSYTQCSKSDPSCVTFSITSARLHTVNYTDVLGVVNYATLSLGLNVSGGSPITSIRLFVSNALAGAVQGPFNPGVNRIVNLTLPATITVSPGKSYFLSVEGFYGSGSVAWESEEVTAK